MEKYILINSPLNYNGGFVSNESILRVTNYAITENTNLVTGSTLPMVVNQPKTININYQLYKSLADFNNGESPIQPVTFPYNLYKSYNDEDLFELLFDDLTTK